MAVVATCGALEQIIICTSRSKECSPGLQNGELYSGIQHLKTKKKKGKKRRGTGWNTLATEHRLILYNSF